MGAKSVGKRLQWAGLSNSSFLNCSFCYLYCSK